MWRHRHKAQAAGANQIEFAALKRSISKSGLLALSESVRLSIDAHKKKAVR
jgi:hypothetical protein